MAGLVDVLVTGDVGYHDAQGARLRGLSLVDAGHAGTEKWVVPALTRYLRKTFKGLRVSTFTEPGVFQAISG